MAVCVLVVLLLRLSIGLVKAQRGQSVTSLLGEVATFSCSPPSHQSFPSMLTDDVCGGIYSIAWRKFNRGVTTNICQCSSFLINYDRLAVDYSDNKYNLRISNVQTSDVGQYLCLTSKDDSTETAHTIQLNIFKPLCSPITETIGIGDHMSLICALTFNRALQWIAPNGTVLASRSGQSNQPLVFNFTAKEEHSFQTFTCVAISESGTYNPECEVTPLEYTFITITPQISRVNQGDNVVFNCDARLGARAPHTYDYTWLRDDNIVLQGLNMSSYIVHDLQLSDNATRVQCKASNDGREEMESSEAVVYVSQTLTTPNPDDARRTRNGGDPLISKRSEYIPPSDTRGDIDNVGLIAGCVGGTVLLLIISVILVVFIKKKKTRKSTGEVEAATTLTRDHDSRTGTCKGRDPSKAPTPGVTNQSSSATNENDAVYALPQQKRGGHSTVTTQDVSGKRSPIASIASGGHAAAGQSGIAATSKVSTPSVANQSSSATNENDAVYALPQQKYGGHTTASSVSGGPAAAGQSGIAATTDDVDATYAEPFKKQDDGITYDNVTDSRVSVDNQESQPNVEGLLYAELDVTNSNATDGQIINTTEATIYAAIQQVQ